jgi:carbon-monoxide dehydrogenase medium subunit
MVLAGGTDLLIQIKTGEYQPPAVVQILDIEELNRLQYEDGLTIGAAVALYRLEEDERLALSYAALHDAVIGLGSRQVRNMATIGGNLCNASPSADMATPLMVLGAEAEIGRLNSNGSPKIDRVSMNEFFTGPGTTVLEPGHLLMALIIPELGPECGSAFNKIGRVKLDMAKISCSAYVERKGDEVKDVRVAIGGAAPTPVRAGQVEKALTGKPFSTEVVEKASREASESIAPISDVRSTEDYRRQVAAVLVRDTLTLAWRRSGGEVHS